MKTFKILVWLFFKGVNPFTTKAKDLIKKISDDDFKVFLKMLPEEKRKCFTILKERG